MNSLRTSRIPCDQKFATRHALPDTRAVNDFASSSSNSAVLQWITDIQERTRPIGITMRRHGRRAGDRPASPAHVTDSAGPFRRFGLITSHHGHGVGFVGAGHRVIGPHEVL